MTAATLAPAAGAPSGPLSVGWAELGLNETLLKALQKAKFNAPTDIQRELIPVAISGRDAIGQAKTGTGKTAAFGLPILQRIIPGDGIQSIILVPTRELALQVERAMKMLAGATPIHMAAILGGRGIKQQVVQLRNEKPEIIIGTPGRVLDLIGRRELALGTVKMAVLDEVDRMLDIGFRDDIRKILNLIPDTRQTIFVSATIDDTIRRLAKSYMKNPAELNVSADVLTVEAINQGFISVDPRDKFGTLLKFLQHEKPTLAIVFTNTKHQARRVALHLKQDNINCKELHGDLMQSRRERVLESFRSAKIQVLVATDIAARGIDVLEVSHIVNYDVPVDPSIYVHRVGRTARMGNKGYAVTFITPEQGKLLTQIEMLINKELQQFDEHWVMKRRSELPQSSATGTSSNADGSKSTNGAPAEPGDATPGRLQESLRRCEVLDAHGLQPTRRTLGSRFKSARKFRR